MATNRLTIRRKDDKLIITSSDELIKQVFFEWADEGENSPLYGRSTNSGCQRLFHDEWQWTLDDQLVKRMISNISPQSLEALKSEDRIGVDEYRANTDVFRALNMNVTREPSHVLDEFTEAYLVAALWSTTDHSDEDGGQSLDLNYDICDIAPEAMKSAVESCAQFQEEHRELLAKAYELYAPRNGYHGPGLAGHDLWLTAAHHGSGFWDRGLGDVGKMLTDAAHKFGDHNIYVGDDRLIYGF